MADPKSSYGRRLLPQYLSEVSRLDPSRLMFTLPQDRLTYSKGSRKVTYQVFERMVDRLAWFLEEKLGRPQSIETIAYIGPNDIRYFGLLTATNKVGYKALFSSPRNNLGNHLHLLKKTSCTIFLKDSVTNVDHIVHASPDPLRVIDIPELEELLTEGEVTEFPFKRTFDEAKDDEALILHSSGSTGQVKPIPWTFRSLAAVDCHKLLEDDTGRHTVPAALPDGSVYIAMPFFHAAAVLMAYLSSIWFNVPITVPPPDAPLSTVSVMESIAFARPEVAMLAPSTIEEASQSTEMLQALGQLKLLFYGGGAINERVGETVVKYVNLQNYIGTTEAGAYPVYPHTDYRNDHAYFKFNPNESGIEFRHLTDDLFELIFVRHGGVPYEFVWDTFPDKVEYSTSDLYRPHPTKLGYWKHAGRADDIILLSNGEKVEPSITERTLALAPFVRVALLYGENRFEVAALLELEVNAGKASREELLEQLKPFIKQANAEVPAHGRLSKDRIIFSKPEKPFVRLPKGSIVRKATFNLYELEIDEIYGDQNALQVSYQPFLKDTDEEDTVTVLASIISQASEVDGLSPEQDFLEAGVDSLKVMNIVRLIRAQLEAECANHTVEKIDASLVYANPSQRKLAKALRNLDNESGAEEQLEKHVNNMRDMIQAYSKNLPTAKPARPPQMNVEISVILTGSTGSLGSYLLDSLLGDSKVVRIFCLNRSADGRKKQEISSTSRGLSINWADRVHFLHADLSQPMLGLDEKLYNCMLETSTHIIHNQWPVNFNIPLSTFEPHLRGIRNLVTFSATAPNQPPILFTSSVGVVTNWSKYNPGTRAPEAEVTDFRIPVGTGYAESKFVGEELLVAAAAKSGIRSLIVRVGQLAGSVDERSIWNRNEWFPSIITSSQELGVLPATLGPMSNVEFVPVDRGARIILDLAMNERLASNPGHAHFFNMINPSPVSYRDLVPALIDVLRPQPRVVSIKNWVAEVERRSKDLGVDTIELPAVKLIDFYRGIAAEGANEAVAVKSSDTDHTEEWSEHMRQLMAVKPEWMTKWVKGLVGGRHNQVGETSKLG